MMLSLCAAGVSNEVYLHDETFLAIDVDTGSWNGSGRFAAGYLIDRAVSDDQDPVKYLPVEVVPIDTEVTEGPALLRPIWDWDATPLPDKRGCAYYSGNSCALTEYNYGHTPDFGGTIGFRCSADPFPVLWPNPPGHCISCPHEPARKAPPTSTPPPA